MDYIQSHGGDWVRVVLFLLLFVVGTVTVADFDDDDDDDAFFGIAKRRVSVWVTVWVAIIYWYINLQYTTITNKTKRITKTNKIKWVTIEFAVSIIYWFSYL